MFAYSHMVKQVSKISSSALSDDDDIGSGKTFTMTGAGGNLR